MSLCILARPLLAAGPFAACDARWADEPDRWLAARCYYTQGLAAGDPEAAVARVEALQAAHPDDGWLHCARGHLALAVGDPGAHDYYRGAILAFAARQNRAGELLALQSLHHLLIQQGRLSDAAAIVVSARGLAPRLETDIQRAVVDLLDATQQSHDGDSVSAQRLAKRAVAVFETEGDAGLLVRAMQLLASVSRDLGHRVAAEAHYGRLDELATRHEQPWARASARLGIALLRLDALEHRPTRSGRRALIPLFDQALAAAEASGHRVAALHAHRLLGDLHTGLVAEEHHRQCLALATDTDALARAACARSIARRLANSDPAAARQLLDRALVINAGVRENARIRAERSILAWQSEPEEQAWDLALGAIEGVEAMREGQENDTGRAKVFSLWLDPYYTIVGALLEHVPHTDSRRLARAFLVSERMRARVLLETLRWVDVDPSSPSEEPKSTCPPTDLAGVQAELSDDEAVLSYLLNNQQDLLGRPTGGAWLLVVTRDDIHTYRLPDRLLLSPAIEVTLGLIPRRDDSAHAPLARLFDQLLAPALGDLPDNLARLTIVADGALHAMPFSALRRDQDGEPVGARIRFAYAPSASFLVCQRQRGKRAATSGSEVLVLADPVTAEGRLPHTRREARAVRRLFGARAQIELANRAREDLLGEVDLAQFGIIHVATHAVVDRAHPDRSAILLSAAGADDGRLEPHEILDLDLRGSVVLLTACRSAGGAISSGEGVMSLARAFFQAGATAVVGGLWPLDDAETADLIERLYRGLAQGMTLRDALAQAQRSLIEDGVAVAGWAGLVALGDTDRALAGTPFRPPGTARRWWIAAVVLGLLVIGAARARKAGQTTDSPFIGFDR